MRPRAPLRFWAATERNTKHQFPSSREVPNFKHQTPKQRPRQTARRSVFELGLVLHWSLEFAIWSLWPGCRKEDSSDGGKIHNIIECRPGRRVCITSWRRRGISSGVSIGGNCSAFGRSSGSAKKPCICCSPDRKSVV